MPHTHMAVDWVIQLAVTIVYPDHCLVPHCGYVTPYALEGLRDTLQACEFVFVQFHVVQSAVIVEWIPVDWSSQSGDVGFAWIHQWTPS